MLTNIRICFLLPLLVTLAHSIVANLTVVSYTPITLNLTFSTEIVVPMFQLLYNEIPIPYTIDPIPSSGSTSAQPLLTATAIASTFLINVESSALPPCSECLSQKYVVLFTEPLEIGDGLFKLDSFVLRAKNTMPTKDYLFLDISERGSLFGYQSSTSQVGNIGVVICAVVIILSYISEVGLSSYNFLILYAYMSLKSRLFTSLAYKIAYIFLFDVHNTQTHSSILESIMYIFIPHFLLISSVMLGVIVRYCLSNWAQKQGIILRKLFYFLSFRVPIVTWQLICGPLIINTVHIFYQHNTQDDGFRYLLTYFNLLIILGFGYMSYFACNPQPNQSESSWSSYRSSWHFELYSAFHMSARMDSIYTRNCKLMTYLATLLPLLFISISSSQIPNLYAQLTIFMYMFIIRPFKLDFLNYCYIFMQGISFSVFIYRYVAEQYIRISTDIMTSANLSKILLANITITCLIIGLYGILSIYELYQKIQLARKTQSNQRLRKNQPRLSIQKKHSPHLKNVKKQRHLDGTNSPVLKQMHSQDTDSSPRTRMNQSPPSLAIPLLPISAFSPLGSSSSMSGSPPKEQISESSRRLEKMQKSKRKEKSSLLLGISMEPETSRE